MQVIKNIITMGTLIGLLLLILASIYVYVPKLLIASEDKYKVLMAGQSVTDHWFRYRELPAALNALGMWRKWPISYDEHATKDYYFKRIRIPSPRKNENSTGYGVEAYNAVNAELEKNKYDAMMFKFCFTDFRDGKIYSDLEVDTELEKMTSLVKQVHDLAKKHHVKLIIGDALPLLHPSEYSQHLRKKYNAWVDSYSKENSDTVKIELYDNLIDSEGKLKLEYSLDPEDDDSHLAKQAYTVLEKELTLSLEKLRNQ